MLSVFNFIDLLGTFVFALSGAVAGLKKQFDVFGIFVISLVTAIGGGVIRDICISSTPPAGLENIEYFLVILLAVFCVFFFQEKIQSLSGLVNFLDAIGLGFFAVFGAYKTWHISENIQLSIILGCVSAVGGGCIRDVLTGKTPLVFQSGMYAGAAIVGASIELLGILKFIPSYLSPWVAIFVCVAIRVLSIRYHMQLPFVKDKNS